MTTKKEVKSVDNEQEILHYQKELMKAVEENKRLVLQWNKEKDNINKNNLQLVSQIELLR